MRALIHSQSVVWAITQEAYKQLLEIAARENDISALAGKLGKALEQTRTAENRDGVAVIPVTGPIFRYANLFTEISGATSTEIMARDFTAAVNDPSIHSIILDINSPGGEADGISELANMIAAARESKPVTAYVGGLAASGGYWIASAASEIVAEEASLLGSVGVVMTMRDTSANDKAKGIVTHEIVSRQSPYKRADPATEEGRSKYQSIVDSLGQVFVDSVARNRGIDSATVEKNFGQGSMLVGKAAVAAGMADRIGTFEGTVAALVTKNKNSGFAANQRRIMTQTIQNQMTLAESASLVAGTAGLNTSGSLSIPITGAPITYTTTTLGGPVVTSPPVVIDNSQEIKAAEAAAVSGERKRIAGILNHTEASGREQLARTLAFETDMDTDAAVKLLTVSAKAVAGPVNPLAAAMAREPNPNLGPNGKVESVESLSLAKQIASWANGK